MEFNGNGKIMEFLYLKCFWKSVDTISPSETSLLGKFYMHQENNAPFMTKNVSFALFSMGTFGTLKKNKKNTDTLSFIFENIFNSK